jgi:hypothetical protein
VKILSPHSAPNQAEWTVVEPGHPCFAVNSWIAGRNKRIIKMAWQADKQKRLNLPWTRKHPTTNIEQPNLGLASTSNDKEGKRRSTGSTI